LSNAPGYALNLTIRWLRTRNYHFITPTPVTHARVIARRRRARDLRDVFGWSLPFERALLPEDVFEELLKADLIEPHGDAFKSRIRVSALGGDTYAHSAFPTTQQNAVFFGPDSYRFARFLRAELPKLSSRRHVVDLGTGSGVGGITAKRALPSASVTLTDINRDAMRYAMANWFGTDDLPREDGIAFATGDGLDAIKGDLPIDCIIANPPYIADTAHRAYRDGGAMHGGAVSLAWARAAAERLTSGGALLLYTGSAIVGGEDRLRAALLDALSDFNVRYEEIDPDVFGEELEREDYAEVERIAVVGVVAVKR